MTGDKLRPYEILASIGKVGMGEVWKAHDPRLNRDVAIQVSSAVLLRLAWRGFAVPVLLYGLKTGDETGLLVTAVSSALPMWSSSVDFGQPWS